MLEKGGGFFRVHIPPHKKAQRAVEAAMPAEAPTGGVMGFPAKPAITRHVGCAWMETAYKRDVGGPGGAREDG